MPEINGAVLAAGAAVAASLLVTARRRRQRDEASTCRKLHSVEVPLRAETPRKALLGGNDELWEEQLNEHGKSTPPLRLAVTEVAIEEMARLKAQLEQLAFENESLHHLNERLLKSAHNPEASPGSSLSPSMLTGATEEASSVDRPPLATTRPALASPAADERTAHVTAMASGRQPAGLALGGAQLAERLFRAHARAAREGQLRLCLFAMREHARRRSAERRFQGLLALKVVEVEEAQVEAQALHHDLTLSPAPAQAPALASALSGGARGGERGALARRPRAPRPRARGDARRAAAGGPSRTPPLVAPLVAPLEIPRSTPRADPPPEHRHALTAPAPPPHYPFAAPALPSHPSRSPRQAAEAAHEARLREATRELDAELRTSEGELRALEAALLASDARHAEHLTEQLRQQRRCMLVGVGCLLARRRLVLVPPDAAAAAYAPYAAQSAATGLRSEGGWADGRGAL